MEEQKKIADIRKVHGLGVLLEKDAGDDPIALFKEWLRLAVESGIGEPNAMTLATATNEGRPSARIMLLKEVNPNGFIFYTNYESRKGGELTQNPFASLVFYWPQLEKQVRVEGRIRRVSREESDKYFHERPRESQIGAHTSQQSRPLPDRESLDRRYAEMAKKFETGVVPLPDYWGGFLLEPDSIEFWQGRPSRLHDRIHFTRDRSGWKRERLNP